MELIRERAQQSVLRVCVFRTMAAASRLPARPRAVSMFGEQQDRAGELAIWASSGIICSGAFVRHGLLAALLFGLSTGAAYSYDPSLQAMQFLNLGAVVYDVSFEVGRLYALVLTRPLLIAFVLITALFLEWILEKYEKYEESHQAILRRSHEGGWSGMFYTASKVGITLSQMLLPLVMGVLIACIAWLLLSSMVVERARSIELLRVPTSESLMILARAIKLYGGRWVSSTFYQEGMRKHLSCNAPSDCIYITGSAYQVLCEHTHTHAHTLAPSVSPPDPLPPPPTPPPTPLHHHPTPLYPTTLPRRTPPPTRPYPTPYPAVPHPVPRRTPPPTPPPSVDRPSLR